MEVSDPDEVGVLIPKENGFAAADGVFCTGLAEKEPNDGGLLEMEAGAG